MASVNLQEKANFTRISRLLVDKGTEALRNTLDAIHPPANLPAVLNANRTTLLKLKPRVINDTQWDLLFPPSGNPPDSKTFDVTLLTVLLRNLAGLPPPATGWNTMPPDTDNSLGANIARIKLFRNQVYGHVTSTQVDKITFRNLWQKISKALIDLKVPQKEIDDLKTCPLGPEEEIYGQSLKEWVLKEEECKNMLDDLTRGVSLIHSQQKDDREVIEQIHQRVQQLCTSSSSESELPRSTHNSEQSKASEKHSREEQLLQKLAKHNFKSKTRSKVKFFHPGTREWLLKRIYSWFADEDGSRLLLLTAGPGFGKSVFAARVCDIFEEKGRLAACHFCDFSNSNLKDPMMMLQSLASHMCQNIVGFKEKLLDQLKRPYKADSLKDAFQIYLQNPLDELDEEHCLIVIDGLDESATDDKSDMVKLIADNFPDLPRCVKVLVTSRPELSLQRLDHIEVIEIDVYDVDNESDILKYLNVCLPTLAARDEMNHSAQPHHWNVLPAIVRKCEGSFLYAFHVQHELCKRKDLDTMTFEDIVSFLPEGVGSIYQAYFRRLEIELEAAMKRNPDLFKLLELLVAIDTMKAELPLKFVARALGLALDCRETKKIINKVNEAVSCLLYVSDDLITVFHKSVCDWLLANGYDDHEYTVKVSDGEKRLWLVCEQVFQEIKRNVSLGHNLKLTNEVTHALEYGQKYLLACHVKDSFSWFVDMIIVYVLLHVYPKSTRPVQDILEQVLRRDVVLSVQLRQRFSWHFAEISYLGNHNLLLVFDYESTKPFSYLESVLHYSPEGCFTDDERKIAEVILAKSPRCVKHSNAFGMKTLKPLDTKLFHSLIAAVGVSSSKKLAAIALENGIICVLSLPELIQLWQYSTGYKCISCCTFALDDTFVLYGKLETVLNIEEKKEAAFFGGEVERFKSCAFSPNGKRLITSDGSDTLKLWDVVRRSLVAVLSAGAPVDGCTFSNTGLFIIGGANYANKGVYCVWNSITLQRVDQRSNFSGSMGRKKDGVLLSERCNRCFRPEWKELNPPKGLGIMASMQLNRHLSYVMMSVFDSMLQGKCCKTSTGIYKEVDCFFHLDSQKYLRVIDSIHFTTLAIWEIFTGNPGFLTEGVPILDIAAVEDDHWLYGDEQKVVLFSSVLPNENQLSLSRPTCVLWCSFSPDGTRLATCTSDGFINIWNVDTSQVYQSLRSNLDTSSAACWWSDKYLFVCHVIDTIPSLSRYPVDRTLKIIVTEKQPMPLCSVNNQFLPFSGFLDFFEGYLSFECGYTEPVKVIDVKKIGHPKVVVLPEIQPKMSIAVSSRASFVLGAGIGGYFLWKKNEAQPSVYNVFVRFEHPSRVTRFIFKPNRYECCFSNDSKFALVSFVMWQQRRFVVIDVDTGILAMDEIHDGKRRRLCLAIPKVFCTDRVVIHLTSNMIEIFDLESWKLLESSFQRHLTEAIHSKLSPKGTVLAVPRLTGDMGFLHLCIPKHSSVSNGQKNWERLGGVKFVLPVPSSSGNIPEVKKKVRESLPGPGGFGNIPKVEKRVAESLPGPSIPKVKKTF
ncbi:E3 ubiquitin- ligase DZIP3 [Paramuricea clavata]|uniref:E3 ubiquitin- ligase DZIP3 n=1 Tax=Paramuricea clavata TaxID=317549 RepID=A0A6S7IWB6_PARCT|nr:E3 ubiquitin- ligase DZIP3 [Paramuricea clavata]